MRVSELDVVSVELNQAHFSKIIDDINLIWNKFLTKNKNMHAVAAV